MQTPLYNELQIKRENAKIKRHALILAALFVVTITTNVLFFVFLTTENALAFRIVLNIYDVAACWAAVYLVFGAIVPLRNDVKFVRRMISSDKKTVTGSIEKIGDEITFSNRFFQEITIKDGRAAVVVYLEKEFQPSFSEGETIEFMLVDRVIFSYKAEKV